MENIVKILTSVLGSAITYMVGGWSALLGTLLTFVVIDYVTGVIASASQGKLSSRIGMVGIAKKVFIFVMVAVAHHVDTTMGQAHFFRDGVIYFYIANELISITENGIKMNAPIPPGIQKAIAILKEKGGEKNEDGGSSRGA